MSANWEERHKISFEQAMGFDELPRQLKLDEIPMVVKTRIWEFFNIALQQSSHRNDYLREPLLKIVLKYYIQKEDGFSDEFDSRLYKVVDNLKRYFSKTCRYHITLGFCEWMMREWPNYRLAEHISTVLTEERCAYRVVDNKSIVPIGSEQEAQALLGALELSAQYTEAQGARKHLLDAASHLTAGNYADSVRDSIHSIESVVRKITGKSAFAEAVKLIHDKRPLHGSLKEALLKLYGYSNDEKGIRHPMLDGGDANVTESDALFMLGTCASYLTYLITITNES